MLYVHSGFWPFWPLHHSVLQALTTNKFDVCTAFLQVVFRAGYKDKHYTLSACILGGSSTMTFLKHDKEGTQDIDTVSAKKHLGAFDANGFVGRFVLRWGVLHLLRNLQYLASWPICDSQLIKFNIENPGSSWKQMRSTDSNLIKLNHPPTKQEANENQTIVKPNPNQPPCKMPQVPCGEALPRSTSLRGRRHRGALGGLRCFGALHGERPCRGTGWLP